MPRVNQEDGNVDPSGQQDILASLEREAEREWDEPRLGAEGDIGAALRAFAALPLDEVEQAFVDMARVMFPSTAPGQMLDKHLDDYLGFSRLAARRATGEVDITLESALSDSDFDPFLSAGSVIFIDTAGNRYDLTEDVTLGASDTTSATAKIRAQETGGQGNVASGQITDVEFVTGTASTRWNNHVSSFTNSDALSGGRDEESDADYFRRFRESNAARPDSTLDGIPAALESADIGVTDADIIENSDLDATQDNTPFNHDEESGSTQTIDGTTTLIAQRVTMPRRRFVQYVNAKLASDTDLVVDVEFQGHDSGNNEPDGSRINDRFDFDGWDFDGTNLTSLTFSKGAYIADAVTFWVVMERTGGSGTFAGGPIAQKVTNGGFETYSTSPGAPDNWNKFATDETFEVTKETTNIDAGSNAVKIDTGADSAPGADIGIEQSLDLEPGIKYEFKVQACTDGSSGEVPTMWVYDVTNDQVVEEVTGTDGGTSYEDLTATLVPEEDVVYGIRLGMRSEDSSTNDVVYFDEASVTNVDVSLKVSSDGGSTWSTEGNVDALFMEVIGGVPQHNFRILAEGGADDDVGQVIYDHRPGGIEGDGSVSATVDTDEGTTTQWFDRILQVPVVFSVTVTTTDDFGGDEDTIRDIIVNYVGGKRTDGTEIGGLGVKDTLVRNEIISRLLEDDRITGTQDVTELLLERQENRSSPSALQSGDTSNLSPSSGEKLRVIDPSTDIEVTLNDA